LVSFAIGDDASDGPPPHRASVVRRLAALAPFSEVHQCELVQAGRLVRAADAAPEERLAAAGAYVQVFFAETVEHFRREEEELFPLYVLYAGSTPTLERVLAEHMQLHGLVRALRTHVAAGEAASDELRALGSLLSEHVRMEERELFDEIQRVVPAAWLERLAGTFPRGL
jgi:Hemerythrin HHE cation binding domain